MARSATLSRWSVPVVAGFDQVDVTATVWPMSPLRSAFWGRAGAAALAQPMAIEGMTLSVETSVGVVVAVTGAPMAELLRRADVAIRQAKRDRTTVVAYDATGDVASTDRLALLA